MINENYKLKVNERRVLHFSLDFVFHFFSFLEIKLETDLRVRHSKINK